MVFTKELVCFVRMGDCFVALGFAMIAVEEHGFVSSPKAEGISILDGPEDFYDAILRSGVGQCDGCGASLVFSLFVAYVPAGTIPGCLDEVHNDLPERFGTC